MKCFFAVSYAIASAFSTCVPPCGIQPVDAFKNASRLPPRMPSIRNCGVRENVTRLTRSFGVNLRASTSSACCTMLTRSSRSIEPELSSRQTRLTARPGWRPSAAVRTEKRMMSRSCANGDRARSQWKASGSPTRGIGSRYSSAFKNSSLRTSPGAGSLSACRLARAVLNDTSLTFSEKVEKLFSAVTVSGHGVYMTDGVGGVAGGSASLSFSTSCFSSRLASGNRDERLTLCGLVAVAGRFLLPAAPPLRRSNSRLAVVEDFGFRVVGRFRLSSASFSANRCCWSLLGADRASSMTAVKDSYSSTGSSASTPLSSFTRDELWRANLPKERPRSLSAFVSSLRSSCTADRSRAAFSSSAPFLNTRPSAGTSPNVVTSAWPLSFATSSSETTPSATAPRAGASASARLNSL